jgi:hypothetical protein
MIGRWHCHVRSLRGARPVGASRVWVLCAPARPVITFDRWRAMTVEIGRSVLNAEDTWTAQGDQTRCSVSGQFDQRIRSLRVVPNVGVQRLFS